MNKETRNRIQAATQKARALLEVELGAQLEGTYDIRPDGTIGAASEHLSSAQSVIRDKLIAAIRHDQATGASAEAAVAAYLREAAFTALNRFIALKMLEARGLLLECVSSGEQSSGFRECANLGLADGLMQLDDHGYRLYIESLFDEIAREVGVLFDRRDATCLLWPRRAALTELLQILNDGELASVWAEDETIGWVFQFFNSSDERKKMRDESQMPRNSRELAVRNQFFTPRYVVEFLVDNTLGRLWLEMYGDSSRLRGLCRYFVCSSDDGAPARPRKDPRDLRILDPACGSGHFLLYCFDLLLVIYLEAWADEEHAVPGAVTGRTLRDEYPDVNSLKRVLPTLILEHNLFGVDIDPRAAQIAALALWMRGQRGWKEDAVPAVARPPVERINIVVAEPMPGDADLVDEFARGLQPPLLADLFREMVADMRLAGELGTLLPVEHTIAAELSGARQQYVREQQSGVQTSLVFEGVDATPKQGQFDLSGVDEDHFFQRAEALIAQALRRFAEATAGGASVRRRLFANDSAQGVALIDLLRSHYDVVLMNPPFGEATSGAASVLDAEYANWARNLLCAFIIRALDLAGMRGMVGAVYDRSANIRSAYEHFRTTALLGSSGIALGVELGWGVLEAEVEVFAGVLLPGASELTVVDVREVPLEEKDARLLVGVTHANRGDEIPWVSTRSLHGLARLPNAVISSAFPEYLLDVLSASPTLIEAGLSAYSGCTLKADQHYRLWWETEAAGPESFHMPMFNGAGYEPYTTIFTEAVLSPVPPEKLPPSTTTRILNRQVTGLPGVCFGKRGEFLAAHVLPAGFFFTQEGRPIPVTDSRQALLLIGYLNTPLIRHALNQYCGQHKTSGYVNQLPFRPPESVDRLIGLTADAIEARLKVQRTVETNPDFTCPVLAASLPEGWDVARGAYELAAELTAISEQAWEQELEDAFGVSLAERRALQDFAARQPSMPLAVPWATPDYDGYVAGLVAYAVGAAFGRFDLRLAAGARETPVQREYFAALPTHSPAVLTGEDGISASASPDGYPISIPGDGILVDDVGSTSDIVERVRSVFEVVFGSRADACWQEATRVLGGNTRAWLARRFFDMHLKSYSRRRKAPIYWQLATPTSSYSVWLYAHRASPDTLYRVLSDYIAPKLRHEERKLTNSVQEAGPSPSASQRKDIALQGDFVEELRSFRDEVARIAPLWHPELDDGIPITCAPLWRLVTHNRAWQRELRAHWEKVAGGDHDWAHLAMHLWPERVVSKCARDRSMAIAHGLQDAFWTDGKDGKWKQREVESGTVDRLVGERSSAAVKAALADLLAAG